MPDVIADKPETSESPVLPNSAYAPVRNPRGRWRSDVLERPTPQTDLPVVSSQNVPAATSSWSTSIPVTHETPPLHPPVTPHIDVQHEVPPPASSTDDDPMPLPHVEDTPPWFYQEPETPWISTKQDTPVIIPQQVPLPIQIPPSPEETNMPTGDSTIPPPPWIDETPQLASTVHEDVLPPVPLLDETPFVTALVPETPVPSVSERWRSDTLHPETPVPPVSERWRSDTLHPETPVPSVSERWRSDTLHPETPVPSVSERWPSDTLHPETSVPTTAPPQLSRCPACLASILEAPRKTTRSFGD